MELFHLTWYLKHRNMLPALVFHLDRQNCERLALGLASTLEKLEDLHRHKTGWYDKLAERAAERMVRWGESFRVATGVLWDTSPTTDALVRFGCTDVWMYVYRGYRR